VADVLSERTRAIVEDNVLDTIIEQAVEIADRVVEWVEAHLEAGGDTSNSRSN